MTWVAPQTVVVGQLVTSALWNQEVRNHAQYVEPLLYLERQTSAQIPTTANSEAAAVSVISGTSLSFDGTTTIEVLFTAPQVSLGPVANATGSAVRILLVEDGVSIGHMGRAVATTGGSVGNEAYPFIVHRRHLPAAGAHIYDIQAYNEGAVRVDIDGGAGGSGVNFPSSLEIRRVLV